MIYGRHPGIWPGPDAPRVQVPPDLEDEAVQALKEIALGRKDCGRPLAAEVVRQKARKLLNEYGIGWAEARKS
jgi:hypothetical protein